jgi:MAP kinase substrate 1
MPDDDGTLAAVLGPAHPGVLSPLPFDVSSLSWINELSPILRAAAGTSSAGGASNGPPPPAYYSDPFVPSPRNLLTTPTTTCAEFFGSLPDF